jgi:hypothetical protein
MTAQEWVKNKYPQAYCKTIRARRPIEYQIMDGDTDTALGEPQKRPYNAWTAVRRALTCPPASIKSSETVKVAIIFYKKEIEAAGGIQALRDKIRGLVGR